MPFVYGDYDVKYDSSNSNFDRISNVAMQQQAHSVALYCLLIVVASQPFKFYCFRCT